LDCAKVGRMGVHSDFYLVELMDTSMVDGLVVEKDF